MTFLLKIVLVVGKLAIGFIVILALLIVVTYLFSRGIQLLARVMGYEASSFFDFLASKFGWRRKLDGKHALCPVCGGELTIYPDGTIVA